MPAPKCCIRVSLQVGDGESVVVLGPNGHGKTTLLRAISGLIRPTGGRVEFDGQVISNKNACRHRGGRA